MSTTQSYSRDHHPPAPVLDIYLSAPDSYEWCGPFQAQLDSGADVTIIPMSLIADLEVPAINEIALISQWRDRHVMRLFQVDIQIADLLLPAIDVARIAGAERYFSAAMSSTASTSGSKALNCAPTS